MTNSPRLLAGALLALLTVSVATPARAQCCSGYSEAAACNGASLTRSRWCIQNTVPSAQNALPSEFCAYGDKVVETLEDVFNIPAGGTFEFQLDAQTGGAHTGTSCGRLGAGVAYDAFRGSAYQATGFWGYLLSLHEAINVWTGKSSSGWPTDWWADHQSAFPNLMDFHIMDRLGVANGDPNLTKAAAAQKKRFYPGGDSADAKVVALDNVFALMPGGDGFAGFSNMFAMQSGDGVKWDSLGVPNPDVKRSEYVVAYMSLAARQRVLSLLQGPGKNAGGNICNGTPDGTPSDAPYTCSEAHVDTIATAHCALAANGKPRADLDQFRSGKYDAIPSGPCGATCPPDECACNAGQRCVARWLGEVPDAGSPGTGGAEGAGGAAAGGAANTGGIVATGGASNAGGQATPNGGTGNGGSAASTGGVMATGGATTTVDGGSTTSSATDSNCGCRVHDGDVGRRARALGAVIAALAVARRRRRG